MLLHFSAEPNIAVPKTSRQYGRFPAVSQLKMATEPAPVFSDHLIFVLYGAMLMSLGIRSIVLALLLPAFLPGLPMLRAGDGLNLPDNSFQSFSEGLRGTLILTGGGAIPDDARSRFVAAIPEAGSVVVLCTSSDQPGTLDKTVAWLKEAGLMNCVSASSLPGSDEFLSESAMLLKDAKGVWICDDQPSRLAVDLHGTDVEHALRRLLNRGGVIGGTSAASAVMSKVTITAGAAGDDDSVSLSGLDLLPNSVIQTRLPQPDRRSLLRRIVTENPDRFGLGIDENTSVIVTGRSMEVLGERKATILLAKSNHFPASEETITAGQFADLTQLRRAARQRSEHRNPGALTSGSPNVPSGSLVIVGGGAMSDDIVDRFLQLAGGPAARLVILPTAIPRQEAFAQGVPGFLRKADVADIRVLPQSYPREIASDDFQQALKGATGVWFGGGRQWNFVDAYEDTSAVELFKDVLRRGGVIGGSSAGATIQGEFLVRGHPLGNTVMMAEGYDRGFAFLPGTAIDQHFSQRKRKPDLIPVIQRHPDMLGIGIDEGTAIVVQGTVAEVIGQHSAWFLPSGRLRDFNAEQLRMPDEEILNKLYVSVSSGETIDLTCLKQSTLSPPK